MEKAADVNYVNEKVSRRCLSVCLSVCPLIRCLLSLLLCQTGENLLLLACRTNLVDVVKVLVEKGFDINFINEKVWSAHVVLYSLVVFDISSGSLATLRCLRPVVILELTS
jgi:hypothetical protein